MVPGMSRYENPVDPAALLREAHAKLDRAFGGGPPWMAGPGIAILLDGKYLVLERNGTELDRVPPDAVDALMARARGLVPGRGKPPVRGPRAARRTFDPGPKIPKLQHPVSHEVDSMLEIDKIAGGNLFRDLPPRVDIAVIRWLRKSVPAQYDVQRFLTDEDAEAMLRAAGDRAALHVIRWTNNTMLPGAHRNYESEDVYLIVPMEVAHDVIARNDIRRKGGSGIFEGPTISGGPPSVSERAPLRTRGLGRNNPARRDNPVLPYPGHADAYRKLVATFGEPLPLSADWQVDAWSVGRGIYITAADDGWFLVVERTSDEDVGAFEDEIVAEGEPEEIDRLIAEARSRAAGRHANPVLLYPTKDHWEGTSRGVSLSTLPKRELARGTKHEHEHVPSVRVARRIAADHLVEDPKYYTHLAEMEARHGNPAPDVEDLRQRAAIALGWTIRDAHSVSLPSLRELVRPVDPGLADEISHVLAQGSHVARQEPRDDAYARARTWLEQRGYLVRQNGRAEKTDARHKTRSYAQIERGGAVRTWEDPHVPGFAHKESERLWTPREIAAELG